MGYNGNYRGGPNTCDTEVEGLCGCIHAEINALLKAPYREGERLVLFTTVAPCVMCAKSILNSRVAMVIYRHEYRLRQGLDLLRANDISLVWVPDEAPAP